MVAGSDAAFLNKKIPRETQYLQNRVLCNLELDSHNIEFFDFFFYK